MIVVPIAMCLFFISLLAPGLPLRVPTAIVDMDHSSLSRSITRSLSATEYVEITQYCDSYENAMAEVRRGNIYGFFVIPAKLERDAVAGRTPTLEYYNNLTYFIPGTLAFKGFKAIAITTSGGMLRAELSAVGMSEETSASFLQPMSIQHHPISNPWMSYAVYLCPSFTFGVLALLILIMTVFGITMEIKRGSSGVWLASAGGRISVAVTAKLFPQFIVWSVVGQLCIALLFCYNELPCGNLWLISLAVELFIIANQALGLFVSCLLPNPRFALSVVSLFGILSFSFTGFSFPVQQMYGAIAIFSYLAPVRYLFLIYTTSGLNEFVPYYSRFYLLALTIFPLVASTMLWRLKKACLKPIYIP